MFPVVKEGRKIRVAIVGCGRISKNHFGSIEKHSEAIELAALCEIKDVVLREHMERYDVPGYRRLSDMLEKEDLDLVVICTPSGIHPAQVVECANAGVSVITEKPMAT